MFKAFLHSFQTFQDLFNDCADIFSNVLDGNNLDGWLELQEVSGLIQRRLIPMHKPISECMQSCMPIYMP